MKNTCLALDIGATHIRAALISKDGEILKRAEELTEKQGKNGRVVTQQVLEIAKEISWGKRSQIKGVGIGVASAVDYQKGGMKNTPNLPFTFIPLVKPLQEAFSFKVTLLNDCLAAVWAEKTWGAGKNLDNLVYITISTGIGGGAIVDGHLLLGKDGNAAEIGHLIVEEKYNFLCTCGKGKGHWEGIASGRNIPRFFRAWSREKTKEKNLKVNFKAKTAKDIFAAAKQRDKIALKFIEDLGKINARALSDIIVAYDPSLITLGGAVALNNKELILRPLKKDIDNYLTPPKIKITPLGEDIVLLGAAASVFHPPNIPS